MSSNNNVIYIGITNEIKKRVYEHREKYNEGFTKKYNVTKLVHYEIFTDAYSAISREKQLKRWHRDWKLNLIRATNPTLKDLYCDII